MTICINDPSTLRISTTVFSVDDSLGRTCSIRFKHCQNFIRDGFYHHNQNSYLQCRLNQTRIRIPCKTVRLCISSLFSKGISAHGWYLQNQLANEEDVILDRYILVGMGTRDWCIINNSDAKCLTWQRPKADTGRGLILDTVTERFQRAVAKEITLVSITRIYHITRSYANF